jgi:hypothetical protein
MVKAKEYPVAKPDFLHVLSPVKEDGSFQFWTPCRTGKLPVEGKPEGEGFERSFTFISGHSWEMQRRIETTLGYKPAWGWWSLRARWKFEQNFIAALPVVMQRHGFPTGQLTAVGTARRPSKGAWEFTFKGGNIQITENFILAKLMDKDVFETDIWLEAVLQTFPELWKQAA